MSDDFQETIHQMLSEPRKTTLLEAFGKLNGAIDMIDQAAKEIEEAYETLGPMDLASVQGQEFTVMFEALITSRHRGRSCAAALEAAIMRIDVVNGDIDPDDTSPFDEVKIDD